MSPYSLQHVDQTVAVDRAALFAVQCVLPGCAGKVKHSIETSFDESHDRLRVPDVSADMLDGRGMPRAARERHNACPVVDEPPHEMLADESGAARDEDGASGVARRLHAHASLGWTDCSTARVTSEPSTSAVCSAAMRAW